MTRKLREFDWHRFWLQEVVFVSVPSLILVVSSHQNPPLTNTRVVVLIVLILVMTILNGVQLRFEKRNRRSCR